MLITMELYMNITALETWYLANHRPLPFRENSNPYYIWVSEIMAQQTQIETVIPYFERFIKRYPTLKDLAETDSDTLHKMVEGIGYYRRFQHMHDAAKFIMDKFLGVFPNTYEDVKSLPGVGEYTAGAIMSIAFNQPYSATDGNVIRVLSRYYGIQEDMRLPANRKRIDQRNQTLIEHATPRIYTQAIMELGALICRPQKPLCESCPLRETCVAYKNKLTETIPLITRPDKAKTIHFITLILSYENQIALVKKEEGLLKGMYLYPQYENTSIEFVQHQLETDGFVIENTTFLADYRHVFSHQIWKMSVYLLGLKSMPKNPTMSFVSDVNSLPMAVAHRKIKTN